VGGLIGGRWGNRNVGFALVRTIAAAGGLAVESGASCPWMMDDDGNEGFMYTGVANGRLLCSGTGRRDATVGGAAAPVHRHAQ
jgi:hypothetical protein